MDTIERLGWPFIVEQLWNDALNRKGTPYVGPNMRAKLVGTIRQLGLDTVPVGDQDAKTNSPGTYRPVGRTCPQSCPFLGNGCYAEGGNVGIHQRRASEERNAALAGAAIAMVWAARTGRVARLHVSGDLGDDGIDVEYVRGLCVIGNVVRRLSGNDVVAWTYTHHPEAEARPFVERMRRHGIAVRISDHLGDDGAVVVVDREHARDLRASGQAVAVCPAQLTDTDCGKCKLCWTRTDVAIAFIVHGGAKNTAANAALRAADK